MEENREQTGNTIPSGASEVPPSVVDLSAGPKKNWFKRFLNWWLGPDTKIGRFNRRVLRTLAWVLGLFALGLLVGYIFFYRPVANELAKSQADLTQARQQAAEMQPKLDLVQGDLSKLQDQDLQNRLDLATAQSHISLLSVITNVQKTRISLVGSDTAGARIALTDAKTALEIIQPGINQADMKLGQSIQDRFALVEKELTGDPKTALSDLAILAGQLADAEKLLFPKK